MVAFLAAEGAVVAFWLLRGPAVADRLGTADALARAASARTTWARSASVRLGQKFSIIVVGRLTGVNPENRLTGASRRPRHRN